MSEPNGFHILFEFKIVEAYEILRTLTSYIESKHSLSLSSLDS